MSDSNQPTTAQHDGTPAVADLDDLAAADISALLDDELEHDRLLEVIDLLVDDAGSRNFYRRSRVLGGLMAAHEPLPTVDASRETWHRIATAVGAPAPDLEPSSRRRSLVIGPWLAAAALLVAVAAGVLLSIGGAPTTGPGPDPAAVEEEQLADITVGSRPDSMTEERFITLATELLEADRRYRREMVEIINAVDSESSGESRSDEPLRFGEGPESSLLERDLDTIEDGRVDRDLSVRRF